MKNKPPKKVLSRYAKLSKLTKGAKSELLIMMRLGKKKGSEFIRLRGIVEYGDAWK